MGKNFPSAFLSFFKNEFFSIFSFSKKNIFLGTKFFVVRLFLDFDEDKFRSLSRVRDVVSLVRSWWL